jgi:hypothetical protein
MNTDQENQTADPHMHYNYSHEQILLSAFDYELRNHLPVKFANDDSEHNVRGIVEHYLRDRVAEIKSHWK